MKTKKILMLILSSISVLFFCWLENTWANPDYICTYTTTNWACNLSWENTWWQAWKNTYFGTMTTSLSFANLRTDCPSSFNGLDLASQEENWGGWGESWIHWNISYEYQACSVTYYDTTSPTGNVYYSNTKWTNSNVTVYVACSDDLSWCVRGSYSKTVSANESWVIRISDYAWNVRDVPYSVTNIDKVAPSITPVTCTNVVAWKAKWPVSCTFDIQSSNRIAPDQLSYDHATAGWNIVTPAPVSNPWYPSVSAYVTPDILIQSNANPDVVAYIKAIINKNVSDTKTKEKNEHWHDYKWEWHIWEHRRWN